MKPLFDINSAFLKEDSRGTRWAIPYNHDCLNARVENLLCKNADHIKSKRVLDIASHIGTFSFAALELGASFVHGIDAEERTVARALDLFDRHKVKPSSYKFEVQDVFHFLENLKEDSFDTVLCFGMLYYTAEPYRLLQLMKRAARDCVLLDTFTAKYAAVQGKDAVEILRNVQDDSFDLPMMLYSRTQSDKKDYRLPNSFEYRGKDLSLTAFPTQTLLEIWFESLGMKFQRVDWSTYTNGTCHWRDLLTPEQKKASRWADVYSSGIRISYRVVACQG